MPTCADMACPLSRWAWAAVTSGGSRGRGGSGWSWWELGSRDASPLQCWGNTTGARLVQETTYFTTCTWHMWHIIGCNYIYIHILYNMLNDNMVTTQLFNRSTEFYNIYIYMVACSVFLPRPRMGPQVAPPSLLFASYWQHFWGPASYLLGLCSLSDYQPGIY